MKVIIAGSRTIREPKWIEWAVSDSGFEVSTVICGMAGGADRLGLNWAVRHKVPVVEMPAFWDKEGKSAGFKRNTRMAAVADALILVWDGRSPGSTHMKSEALRKGLKVYEKIASDKCLLK